MKPQRVPNEYDVRWLTTLIQELRDELAQLQAAMQAAETDIDGLHDAIPSGVGDPEGVFTAPVGTLYRRTDGGTNTTLYIKESGSDSSGWRGI
jgi:hypothetical protein